MSVRLPLALTLGRLVAGPIFVALAETRVRSVWFIGLLAAGLVSDIADGMLARRLGVVTLALRQLDTRADMVFYGGAVGAALWRAPSLFGALLPWLVGYAALFALRNLVDYWRYRASPAYHMWSGKLWSILLFCCLAGALAGHVNSTWLAATFGCYAVNAAEGIAASLLLNRPGRDLPSLWYVWKRRRELNTLGYTPS